MKRVVREAFEDELAEAIRTRARWIWLGAIAVWSVSLLAVDRTVFTLGQALAVRIPEILLAGSLWFWLRRPRKLWTLEATMVGAWVVIASVSALGFLVIPPDKLSTKVASLVLSILFVCAFGSYTWRANFAVAIVTAAALSTLVFTGAGSLYRVTLTVVGFAFAVIVFSSLARDRLKRAEFLARRALGEANEKLRRDDEVKRRLFVNLSHDFRTPLAIVRGEAELLRGSHRFAEDESSLERIEANARSLADLADQLLDLARLEAGQMPVRRAPCDVARVAREVGALLEPPGGKRRVVTVAPVARAVADVDPDHLRRILSNLVANALRHSASDVTLLVSAVNAVNAGTVSIDVSDDGPGILPERRETIFQRFVSFDSDGSTTSGIGLPLARELADMNGGSLELTVADKTTFRVTLLATDAAPEDDGREAPTRACAREPREITAPAGQAERLLIVEDNDDMASLLGRVLADRFAVERASTVAAALASLERRVPHVVLCDVLLPDGTGYDVLSWVRARRELEVLPFILVSALSEVEQRVRGLSAGADDYLAKPFAPEELKTRVTAACERAEKRRRALDAQRDTLLMEIHDGVSASLTRAAMLLADPEREQNADHARNAIRDGLDEVRAITRLLAPRASDWAALTAEIRRAMADACQAGSLSLDFEASSDPDTMAAVPPAVAHTLRRLAREATTNVLKHARAKKMTCRMRAGRDTWTIVLEDDGRGFPEITNGGQGLGIMQRRLARIGGEVNYGNRPAGGAFISASLPNA